MFVIVYLIDNMNINQHFSVETKIIFSFINNIICMLDNYSKEYHIQ